MSSARHLLALRTRSRITKVVHPDQPLQPAPGLARPRPGPPRPRHLSRLRQGDDSDPAATDDDATLARILALNLEDAAGSRRSRSLHASH